MNLQLKNLLSSDTAKVGAPLEFESAACVEELDSRSLHTTTAALAAR